MSYNPIILHIAFKIVRPFRYKYRLNVNCLLVLNACYIYTKYVKPDFAMTAIKLFLSYYSHKKISIYIKALTYRGFIECTNNRYKLTEPGIQLGEELQTNCDLEYVKFINQYNISL